MSPPICDRCQYSAYYSILVSVAGQGAVTVQRWCLSCVRGDDDE